MVVESRLNPGIRPRSRCALRRDLIPGRERWLANRSSNQTGLAHLRALRFGGQPSHGHRSEGWRREWDRPPSRYALPPSLKLRRTSRCDLIPCPQIGWLANRSSNETGLAHLRALRFGGQPSHDCRSEGWRREWDSNFPSSFRFCNLQILKHRRCRGCHRCRGALPAIARR